MLGGAGEYAEAIVRGVFSWRFRWGFRVNGRSQCWLVLSRHPRVMSWMFSIQKAGEGPVGLRAGPHTVLITVGSA